MPPTTSDEVQATNPDDSAARADRHVRFTLDSTNTPTIKQSKYVSKLNAADQRRYDKLLPEAKIALQSQQPEALMETVRELSITMVVQSQQYYDIKAREDEFTITALSSEPYIPNDIKIKAKLTPSDRLKDDTEAQQLVDTFQQDLQTCKEKLSKHYKTMAQLETKAKSWERVVTFVTGLLKIITERVNNKLQDRTTHDDGANSIDLDTNTFATVCAVKFIKYTLPSTYCEEYLHYSQNKVIQVTLQEATSDSEKWHKIESLAGLIVPVDGQESHSSQSTTNDPPTSSPTLNQFALQLDEAIRNHLNAQQCFELLTIDSQKAIDKQKDTAKENARIVARRKAQEKEDVTAATAAALGDEGTVDKATMVELIHSVAKKEVELSEKKKSRKKSGGRRGPKTTPKNKTGANASGQSPNENDQRTSKQKKKSEKKKPANGNGKGSRKEKQNQSQHQPNRSRKQKRKKKKQRSQDASNNDGGGGKRRRRK